MAWAASRPDHIPVRILLEHGASLEITDNRYKTPLHYAAGSGAPESVRLILEAIKTPKGDRATPIQSLIDHCHSWQQLDKICSGASFCTRCYWTPTSIIKQNGHIFASGKFLAVASW
ncbi:hypothetical protein DL95DRAFT_458734 [Leptodontidium sp. 2 PMI_412]|nr:hypothetical protein DL95DRAFT_458734 [Leptodontidium sp. 2 PMI_412]